MAPVQRAHADRIARDQVALARAIPQREGEDAVERVQPGRRCRPRSRYSALITSQSEPVWKSYGCGQLLLQLAVVVDLAVDRQHQLAVGRTQRLRAAGRIDDGQALVDEDRAVVQVHAAPVGAAMALALRQLQRAPAQGLDVVAGLQAEDAEDGTHGRTPGG